MPKNDATKDSMQHLEMDSEDSVDSDLEFVIGNKKDENTRFKVSRYIIITVAIGIGLFVSLVVIPDSSSSDVNIVDGTVLKSNKEFTPKIHKGERYPYEAENWCLNHAHVDDYIKGKCREKCENPLAPKIQLHYMMDWYKVHESNKEAAQNSPNNTDVVFLGDQYFEGFTGFSLGTEDDQYEGCKDIFKSFFSVKDGADYQGLSLAIADDRTNNVLWRLQNGELPSSLQPKVFWIEAGTNNFRQILCSDEVVARGIERIVEELIEKRPESQIVINGILPRTDRAGTSGRLHYKAQHKKHLLNVWNGIELVNDRLRTYAENYDNVHYVDSSDLFIEENTEFGEGDDAKYIPDILMANHVDLSKEGYRKWGASIVDKLNELIPLDSNLR